MRWLRVRELVRKEFIQLFRDKKNRPLLVMAPLIQLLIFGYVVTTDVRDIRVALLDYSRTKESRMLFDAMNASKTFRITHLVDHPQELDRLILDRKVDLLVTIGPEFAHQIRKGESAAVQILVDGSMSNMASVRIAYTTTVLERLNNQLIRELYGERMHYGQLHPLSCCGAGSVPLYRGLLAAGRQ